MATKKDYLIIITTKNQTKVVGVVARYFDVYNFLKKENSVKTNYLKNKKLKWINYFQQF